MHAFWFEFSATRTGLAQARLGCFWLVSPRFDLLQRAADLQQPISDSYAHACLPHTLHMQVILWVKSSSQQKWQRERKAPFLGGIAAMLRAVRPSGKLLPRLLAEPLVQTSGCGCDQTRCMNVRLVNLTAPPGGPQLVATGTHAWCSHMLQEQSEAGKEGELF